MQNSIPEEDLERGRSLKCTSSRNVFKCTIKSSGVEIAVKEFFDPDDYSFENELEMLASLKKSAPEYHHSILFDFSLILSSDKKMIGFPLAPEDLHDFVLKNRKWDVLKMFGQIFGALEGLEAAGICHNDIKKRNFLVFPDQTVKLIDFGISHFIDYNNETLAHPDFYRCTPGHRPPEYQIAWALAETWKCQGCNTKTDGKSCSESDCPHDKVNRSVGRSLGLYTRFPLPRDLRFPNNNSSDVWSAAVTFLFCLDTKENGLEKDEHCEYHTLGSAFRWSLVQKLDPEWFISRLVERTGVQFPKVKSYIDLDQSFQSNPEQIKLLVPIIKACLHPDPFLRPTPKQIMQMFKKAIEE